MGVEGIVSKVSFYRPSSGILSDELPKLKCIVNFPALETVTQKRRVVYSCLWDILSSLGSALFGLIAWRVPYWRHLMRAIYAPLLVAFFYIFLVDEGVR